MSTAPVTAVVVSKNPRLDHYAMTLRSLADQNSPPREVLLVDSTRGGHAANPTGSCSLCEETVGGAIESLRDAGVSVRTLHRPAARIGEARRVGLDNANESAVWHLDEDAVIVSEDWTERALSRLDEPDVAAVGGNVAPLRENTTGRVFGGVDAATQGFPGGWYIMYPKQHCKESGECVMYGQGRGEDFTTRDVLTEHGSLVRDPDLLAKKDLPTSRQKKARNVALSAASGALTGAVATKLMDGITDRIL